MARGFLEVVVVVVKVAAAEEEQELQKEEKMKYQKYITVMQMAMGVTASNKDCLPTKRQLW